MKRPTRAQIEEQVGILAACSLIGMDLPPGVAEGRAVKVHCPFGEVHHADGGIEPAMRIYVDSNHVHCFAGCGSFRPIGLVAHAFDITRNTALRELVDRTGNRSLIKYRDVWTETLTGTPPDTSRLAEALKTFCRRIDHTWAARQFDGPISGQLGKCLSLLDHVKSEQAADLWLDSCKLIMTRVLSDPELRKRE